MICYNCDNRFDMVVDGDKYWVRCHICNEGFCSQSCLDEHLWREDYEGIRTNS